MKKREISSSILVDKGGDQQLVEQSEEDKNTSPATITSADWKKLEKELSL
jgi:hypothetical protein